MPSDGPVGLSFTACGWRKLHRLWPACAAFGWRSGLPLRLSPHTSQRLQPLRCRTKLEPAGCIATVDRHTLHRFWPAHLSPLVADAPSTDCGRRVPLLGGAAVHRCDLSPHTSQRLQPPRCRTKLEPAGAMATVDRRRLQGLWLARPPPFLGGAAVYRCDQAPTHPSGFSRRGAAPSSSRLGPWPLWAGPGFKAFGWRTLHRLWPARASWSTDRTTSLHKNGTLLP
jgi:hypothetical protein